jgi:hypothetical protein
MGCVSMATANAHQALVGLWAIALTVLISYLQSVFTTVVGAAFAVMVSVCVSLVGRAAIALYLLHARMGARHGVCASGAFAIVLRVILEMDACIPSLCGATVIEEAWGPDRGQ